MATKQVTGTFVKEMKCCDLCNRDCDIMLSICWVCGRDACWKCRHFAFAARSGDVIDFVISTCTDCRKHTEIVEKIKTVLAGANNELRQLVGLWKKAAAVTPAASGGGA